MDDCGDFLSFCPVCCLFIHDVLHEVTMRVGPDTNVVIIIRNVCTYATMDTDLCEFGHTPWVAAGLCL